MFTNRFTKKNLYDIRKIFNCTNYCFQTLKSGDSITNFVILYNKSSKGFKFKLTDFDVIDCSGELSIKQLNKYKDMYIDYMSKWQGEDYIRLLENYLQEKDPYAVYDLM